MGLEAESVLPNFRRAVRLALSLAFLATIAETNAWIVTSNSEGVLTLDESGLVASLQLSPAEFAVWTNGSQTFADRTSVTHRIFADLNDSYDFIFLINDLDTRSGSTAGTYYGVYNNITGLGVNVFDNRALYGATGTLQGLIYLAEKQALPNGPSLHELTHRFGNSLKGFPTTSASHWGASSVGGQLGGWQYGTRVSLGGTNYDAEGPLGHTTWYEIANGGNSVPYSDLELYLMGLTPTNSVTNVTEIALGFSWTIQTNGSFGATGFLFKTIGDIVASNGVRSPAYGVAPTNFRALAVVLCDSPLNPERWASYTQDVAAFSMSASNSSSLYNFWEATGGRAILRMDDTLSTLYTNLAYPAVLASNLFTAVGDAGAIPSPTNFNCCLSNSFPVPLTWTGVAHAPWLTITPSGGTLSPGGTDCVSIAINPDVCLLDGGAHETEVWFTNSSANITVSRKVRLTLYEYADLPFSEGFESTAFGPCWLLTGNGPWSSPITDQFAPHGGTYHLGMESTINSTYATNEVTLGVNLDGYTNVILTFWAQDLGDESHGPPPIPFTGSWGFDGVAISSDNTNWYEVQGLRSMPNTNYTFFSVNISTAIATYGLSYSPRFRIRFNHCDNWTMRPDAGGDGITIDDITLAGILVDTDADGMPDVYERTWGLNVSDPSDSTLDNDGDGSSNYDEYLADTCPTNPASCPLISQIFKGADTLVTIPTSRRRIYTLKRHDSWAVGEPWVPITGASNIAGSGYSMTFTNSSDPGATARYYRVWISTP